MNLTDLDFFGESNLEDEEENLFPIATQPKEYEQLTVQGDLGFSPLLPIELALKTYPESTIYTQYGYTQEEFYNLARTPAFVSALSDATQLVKEEGGAFKLKARIQAEEMLKTSWTLVHNNDTPSSVRADLIKWTARVAGFEPKQNEQFTPNKGSGFSITINIPQTPSEPTRIEKVITE